MESSLVSIRVVAVADFLERWRRWRESRWEALVSMLRMMLRVLGRLVMGVGGNMRERGIRGGFKSMERCENDAVLLSIIGVF